MNDDNLDFKLNRNWPSVEVPISEIKVDESELVDRLVPEKYSKFIQGKLKLYFSRLSIDKIKPGCYVPTKEGLVYKYKKPVQEKIEVVKQSIRNGSRPLLYLYPSILKGDDSFLCSDDLCAYNAYIELGITIPPVAIYASKRNLDEACYIMKGYSDKSGFGQYVDGFVYHHQRINSTLLEEKQEVSPKVLFETLINRVKETSQNLKRFHVESSIDFHYHHTVFSILKRAEESLESISILFEKEFYLSAASVTRTLYETALNFYIDWLSPDIIYKHLQLASITSDSERKEAYKLIEKTQIEKGMSKANVARKKDALKRCDYLATTVYEKAKMFPIATDIHQKIYSTLSKVTHHSFSINELEFKGLNDKKSDTSYNDIIITIIFITDIAVSKIIEACNGDIGNKI
ncbi:DUF5677 domain-containing protein [Pseudoalteromonas sp. PS5]|uniref:DUF5677 domain-containing protein n=1 Tax=Pseudoalteromonas sp. PS5 TaxID=1437473 RepID=UPI000FFEBA74|nr:DUF5677 domain-containing protein [Pseudoalteromonas sp. PS5]RXF00437.1 hypothetical protein D9603_15215 [Pseudoalteromonas sp. PS5]